MQLTWSTGAKRKGIISYLRTDHYTTGTPQAFVWLVVKFTQVQSQKFHPNECSQ
jgi:hypothetical protein